MRGGWLEYYDGHDGSYLTANACTTGVFPPSRRGLLVDIILTCKIHNIMKYNGFHAKPPQNNPKSFFVVNQTIFYLPFGLSPKISVGLFPWHCQPGDMRLGGPLNGMVSQGCTGGGPGKLTEVC